MGMEVASSHEQLAIDATLPCHTPKPQSTNSSFLVSFLVVLIAVSGAGSPSLCMRCPMEELHPKGVPNVVTFVNVWAGAPGGEGKQNKKLNGEIRRSQMARSAQSIDSVGGQ